MKWRTISIFISSTFNDMHAERDYIRKVLVPRLNNALAKYKIFVQATDLRWGVSTVGIPEEEREAKVLHVCLNAIKNSKPYFIALLGDRYGWMPSLERTQKIISTLDSDQQSIIDNLDEEISVTELEILLGSIGSSQLLDHSFFCFRQIDDPNEIPSELKPIYLDLPDSKANHKLTSLKKRIIDTCKNANQEYRTIFYSPYWNNDRKQFEQLDQLGEKLFDAIVSDITHNIDQPHSSTSTETLFEEENEALEDFINLNVMNFIGRKELLSNLVEFIFSRQTAQGALERSSCRFLSGFSGCGKSYVFSALCKELEQYAESKKVILLTHAAGITRQSVSTRNMVYRWCRQLLDILKDTTTTLDPKDSVAKFQSLILRVQAQGFFPVIIIDSLDSFTSDRDHVLRDFKFIPHSIPVICTTLPTYADSIVKANPTCEIREIDYFSREDAIALISHRLQSNVKELTSTQIESILAKVDSSGRPSYESPLWLQLTLSILMELGSDDFHSIHKQQFEEEDRKIEAYLNLIIAQLPSEPATLFAYFINLTSKYFNPQLTNKVLSLIALTIDGVDDTTLSALIGDDWDTLEFTSLLYWMRDFIRRDTQTGKWKFTHNILRDVVRNFNPSLIEHLTHSLFEHIEKSVQDTPDILNEYIYMLIDGKHYEKLYQFIAKENTNNLYNTAKAVVEIVSYFDKESLLSFFSTMINQYHLATMTYRFMDNVISGFVRQARKKASSDNIDFIIQLSLLLPQNYSNEEIYGGNPNILSNYLDALGLNLSVYEKFELTDLYVEAFENMYEVFITNKSLHDTKFLSWGLIHSMFFQWELYISNFCKDAWQDDAHTVFYIKEVDRMFDALEWYVDNLDSFIDPMYAPYDYRSIGHRISSIVDSFYFRGSSPLSNAKLAEYIQRLQAMLLKTYSDEEREGFIEDANMLIEKYIDIYKPEYNAHVEPFETTLLMEFLNHPGYEELHVEMEEEAKARLDKKYAQSNLKIDHNTGIVSPLNPEIHNGADNRIYENKLNEEEWEEIDIEELRKPAWLTTKTYKPTHEIVRKQLDALDNLLANFDPSNLYTHDYDDMMENYRNRIFSIAEDMTALGEKEEALTLLKNAEIIFSRPIVEMGENYVIRDERAKNIKSLGEFYEYIHEGQKAISFMETIIDSIWESYYHHISGLGQRWLLNYLDSLYYTYNMTGKRIQLEEKRVRIASESHREHLAYSYYSKYAELHYVELEYDDLHSFYIENGDIEKCVTLLNSWEELVNETYKDGYRKSDAKEKYDTIDQHFAKLCEENPSMVDKLRDKRIITDRN